MLATISSDEQITPHLWQGSGLAGAAQEWPSARGGHRLRAEDASLVGARVLDDRHAGSAEEARARVGREEEIGALDNHLCVRSEWRVGVS